MYKEIQIQTHAFLRYFFDKLVINHQTFSEELKFDQSNYKKENKLIPWVFISFACDCR